jgi:hypothetical protein
MAGECVRCRSGGVISGGPMAAVSRESRRELVRRLVKWLEGAGTSARTRLTASPTYRTRARMRLSAQQFVAGPALRCRCPSRCTALVLLANEHVQRHHRGRCEARAGFRRQRTARRLGGQSGRWTATTMVRDSIGVAGAARMLWLRGRGLRALQMQRVSATREYDRRISRWGAMHGPGADVAVTSHGGQAQRETTCRARHDAPVVMSWHSSELTRIMWSASWGPWHSEQDEVQRRAETTASASWASKVPSEARWDRTDVEEF